MIDLYLWTTDNGYKARHAMEESGLPHTLKPLNFRKREQFAPEFLKISPGHKIPAIVDPDGPGGARVALFESGAVLKYLGTKAANGLYPTDALRRIEVDKWLFWGSASFTTLAQQFGFFWHRSPEDVPFAKKHYASVLRDLLGMLNGHLANREYVADGYTVADIAIYADVHRHGVPDIGLDEYPNVRRWHDAIAARPATQRAWEPFA
ncbi:MAG TPA: glutathione S-transferase family protein [Alphaproteobacteria bacterium]|nr:glutathione S-transferase family protein [Alphaproteobacteria bacterium]